MMATDKAYVISIQSKRGQTRTFKTTLGYVLDKLGSEGWLYSVQEFAPFLAIARAFHPPSKVELQYFIWDKKYPEEMGDFSKEKV